LSILSAGIFPAAGNYWPGLEKLGEEYQERPDGPGPPPSFTTPDKMLLKVPLFSRVI
jgi:hypothetical protein